MTPTISGITPFFIVANVPATPSFYRDKLGFEVTFRGPSPEDEFFGIVRRDGAVIWFKALGEIVDGKEVHVDPVPNFGREPAFSWDAYLEVPDPDALAAEFASRGVLFSVPLTDRRGDGLRGEKLKLPPLNLSPKSVLVWLESCWKASKACRTKRTRSSGRKKRGGGKQHGVRQRVMGDQRKEYYEPHAQNEHESPGLGVSFLDDIQQYIAAIVKHPNAGTKFRGQVRRHILRRFPYGILYSVKAGGIRILAIMNLKRRPTYWVGRS